MIVPVYIYPNDRLILEIPDDIDRDLADNDSHLSHEEIGTTFSYAAGFAGCVPRMETACCGL